MTHKLPASESLNVPANVFVGVDLEDPYANRAPADPQTRFGRIVGALSKIAHRLAGTETE